MMDRIEAAAAVKKEVGYLAGAAVASGNAPVREAIASDQKLRKVHRQTESCLDRNQSEKNGLLPLYYHHH